jgi:hypothetical protein
VELAKFGEDREGVFEGEERGEEEEEVEEEKEKREGEVRDWRWLGEEGKCMMGLVEGLLGRWWGLGRCCWGLVDLTAGCCFCWLVWGLATGCFEPFLAPGLCR